MPLATVLVSVSASEAPSLRDEVLDKRRLDGLTYRVVSPWWSFLSTKFELTGPPGVLESTEASIDAWRSEMWAQRQW